jgi:hypothetical protein
MNVDNLLLLGGRHGSGANNQMLNQEQHKRNGDWQDAEI